MNDPLIMENLTQLFFLHLFHFGNFPQLPLLSLSLQLSLSTIFLIFNVLDLLDLEQEFLFSSKFHVLYKTFIVIRLVYEWEILSTVS